MAELERNSDQWWIERLAARFTAIPPQPQLRLGDSQRYQFRRCDWLDLLWNHRNAEAPLKDYGRKYMDSTREFLRLTKTNFAGAIVDAMLDRVQPIGARKVATPEDTDGDDDIRRFFTLNGGALTDAIDFALSLSEGHVLITGDGNGGAIARAFDPRQMIVYATPDAPTDPVAALLWDYDDVLRQQSVWLYRRDDPDGRRHEHMSQWTMATGTALLDVSGVRGEPDAVIDLIQGAGLPIVTFRNRGGYGEFEPHLDLIDRITNGIADRLWAAKFQVFIQKGVIGSLPQEDAEGNPVNYNDIFEADPAALWMLPEGSQIWESKQLMMNELLAPIREDVKELAMASRTPFPLLASDSVNQSANGVDLYKDGIGFKAEDRRKRWGPAVVRFAKLGMAYSGKPDPGELEPMFAPIERESALTKAQAGSQAKGSGAPLEGIWSDIMHMSPETVRRWKALKEQEALIYGDATA